MTHIPLQYDDEEEFGATAVAAPSDHEPTEDVERAIAFAIEPFLRTQITDGNWTEQAFAEVARECARLAVATSNAGPKQERSNEV